MFWHYSKKIKTIFPFIHPYVLTFTGSVFSKNDWRIVLLIMILKIPIYFLYPWLQVLSLILIVHSLPVFHFLISCSPNCFINFLVIFTFFLFLFFLFISWAWSQADLTLVSHSFPITSLKHFATSITTSFLKWPFLPSLDVFPLPTGMFRSPLDQKNILLIVFLTLVFSFLLLLIWKDYSISPTVVQSPVLHQNCFLEHLVMTNHKQKSVNI